LAVESELKAIFGFRYSDFGFCNKFYYDKFYLILLNFLFSISCCVAQDKQVKPSFGIVAGATSSKITGGDYNSSRVMGGKLGL
jgi:hypothetical protein